MKVLFLGVGEACDEDYPNNSHLILSGTTTLLLDCGYSVPGQLWRYDPSPSFLDAIYISHRHADHYFGIPALLVRMWEEKRTKPLTFICRRGLREIVRELIEYGYKGLSGRLQFRINFMEVEEKQTIALDELKLTFAPTIHSAENLAVRVSDGNRAVCYSGDGMFNEETERLYKGADLLIHESYQFARGFPGHACIEDLISMAERNNVRCLALTHLQRNFRKKELADIKSRISRERLSIIIPEPFEEYLF